MRDILASLDFEEVFCWVGDCSLVPYGEGAIEAAPTVASGRKMTVADHPNLHFC